MDELSFRFYINSNDDALIEVRDYLWGKLRPTMSFNCEKKWKGQLRYILVNCLLSMRIGLSVHYSRSHDFARTYMPVWYSHERMLGCIDWLEEHGYIDHSMGSFGKRLQSTFRPTEKLIELLILSKGTKDLNKIKLFKEPPKKLILMKDEWSYLEDGKKDKRNRPGFVDMKEKPINVVYCESWLRRYNKFINSFKIGGEISSDMSMKVKHYIQLMNLWRFGYGKVDEVEWFENPIPEINVKDRNTKMYTDIILKDIIYQGIHNKSIGRGRVDIGGIGRGSIQGTCRKVLNKYLYYDTLMIYEKSLKNDLKNIPETYKRRLLKIEHHKVLESILEPEYLKIDSIKFTISYNHLYRVFNYRNWKKGGRFYGAGHIALGSTTRKALTIDGVPTIELDFSGHHIRMLYHQIGIDFKDECYVYKKGENDEARLKLKLLQLIAINSNREVAPYAILDKWEREGLTYKKGEVQELMRIFEDYHEPIKSFLFTEIGPDLQYQDSEIMYRILKHCYKLEIPALPVHDSVIVPFNYEKEVKNIMNEEYFNMMKYYPVID